MVAATRRRISPPYRARVERYGSDAARASLKLIDDLWELLGGD